MKRIVIGITLVALLLGLVAVAQAAMNKDQEIALQSARAYIKEFIPQIKFAQKVDVEKLIEGILAAPPELLPDGVMKVGSDYALYYRDDPAYSGCSRHTFGWYSETVGCGALYPLVYGARYFGCHASARCTGCSSPHTNVPIGWKIHIPDSFGRVGFWLNWPYPPTGSVITTGGLYYTNPSHNWDHMPHAYVFLWRLPFPISLYVTCDGASTTMVVRELYVILWEDWCHGGDHDWNDFVVAVFH